MKPSSVMILSHELTEEGPFFGGKSEFIRSTTKCLHKGDSCNQESWTLSNHVGTHVDCPAHFSDQGKRVTDYKPEEWVFFKTFLFDLPAKPDQIISPDSSWEQIPVDTDLLLIRTGFEKERGSQAYWNNNPGLSPESGHWLRKNRPALKMLGLDFISITGYQNRSLGKVAHQALLCPDSLSEGLRVIEDMKLSLLTRMPKTVVVSPVWVAADGSPVTVMAFDDLNQ